MQTTETGVLLLHFQKTFGYTDNKKRLLYKCIPFKKQEPILVAYEIKLGFSKHIKNRFIVFNKKPADRYGTIEEDIGDVDDVIAYSEYQYISRKLRFSLRFYSQSMKTGLPLFDRPVENRFFENTFTIDGASTTDYDDAFSISVAEDGSCRLSIYIINVAWYVEQWNLWETMKTTVFSNIYLPHKKVSIFPPAFIEKHLSLKRGTERYTLCIDIHFDKDKRIVGTPRFSEALVHVKHNMVYESNELLHHAPFQQLAAFTPATNGGSHEIVAHWMEFYSQATATLKQSFVYLHHYKRPSTQEPAFLQKWKQSFPKGYYLYNEHERNDYIHCTSPIRRIVDIYNQSIMLSYSWSSLDLNLLNEKCKQIRKLQMETTLMNTCFQNTEIMNRHYSGVVFDVSKTLVSECKDQKHTYMVFVPELNLISQWKSTTELEIFSQHTFQLFLFQDEYQINKKIKIIMV